MIVVDAAIHPFKGQLWCHMASDVVGERGLVELHAFARRIGLREQWFQDKDLPHYDLSPNRRAHALQHGARSVDIMEMGTLIGHWREWKHKPKGGEAKQLTLGV